MVVENKKFSFVRLTKVVNSQLTSVPETKVLKLFPEKIRQLLDCLSIKKKIYLGYTISIFILLLGITASQILGDYYYEAEAKKRVELIREQSNLFNKLRFNVITARNHQQQFIFLLSQPKSFHQHYIQFLKTEAEVTNLVEEINDLANRHHRPEWKLFLKTHQPLIENYFQEVKLLLEKINWRSLPSTEISRAQQTIISFTNAPTATEFERFSQDVEALLMIAQKEEDRANEEVEESEVLGRMLVGSTMLISLVVALALAYYTSCAIAQPIESAIKVAQQATEKANFTLRIPVTTRDEVGILAHSFNNLIQKVAEYTQELELARQTLEQRVEERTAALYKSESRLQSILSFLQDTVWSASPNKLELLYLNPASKTIFHRSEENFFNNPRLWKKIVFREDWQRVKQCYRQILTDGKFDVSCRIIRPDGEIRWVNNRAWIVYDDRGNPIRIDGIVRDITEYQLAEEKLREALSQLQQTQTQLIQKEKMSSLGQMVGGVAHEINNPINFIYGNISYVKSYVQDLLELINLYHRYYPQPVAEVADKITNIELDFLYQDLPKTLNSMQSGTERIRQIILSLRNFSRLDESEVKEADIHKGIDSTLLILNHRLVGGIKLIKKYGELPLIECCPAQLNQVFFNIISNAIDALEEAIKVLDEDLFQPTIEIGTSTINYRLVEIGIWNNGPAIAPEILHKLFDPFFTTKPVGQGTGLGLSVCYRIIEQHHGKINVYSESENGTKFTILLPIKS